MSIQRPIKGEEGVANDVLVGSAGKGVDKKVVQSPLVQLIDFLSNDWRKEMLAWQKTEKLRQRLLENQEELRPRRIFHIGFMCLTYYC